ncbi:MAG TPA: AAA family ATPase [Vicinamibacterales bacterium]|nr:AAA family ATPase [Vicinamibacterales bacterium]
MALSSGSLASFQPQADSLTYEEFFGLKEKAFSLSADPRFLYRSPSHAATFENLLTGIRRREGLLVLTGEIGTGKTLLCRAVLRSLGRKTFSSFVPDPFASREDLLKMLLIDFGVISIQDLVTGPFKHATRAELSYLLTDFLETAVPPDAFVVVIIDEAQNMSLPLIEETRILADAFGGKGRLQIVFVGQLELHAKLKLPEMRQVDQRVCGYNRLATLSENAVSGYIQHRLHVAGGSRERPLFAPEVIELLHRRTGGVPRLINRICDRALHLAHRQEAAWVDREILETALIDVGSTTLAPTWASIVCPEPVLEAPPVAPAAPIVAIAEVVAHDEAAAPVTVERVEAVVNETAAPVRVENVEAMPSEVAAPAMVESAALALDEAPVEEFSIRVDEWLARELRSHGAQSDAHSGTAGRRRHERRSRWSPRVAVAVSCVALVGMAAVGGSLLASPLTGLRQAPLTLASLPAAPALAVTTFSLPPGPVEEQASVQASPVLAPGDFMISVGLFASQERANRLVGELTEAGLPAAQRPFQLRSRRVQQVVLGPFTNRAEAVADLQRLRGRGGYQDANIVESAAAGPDA